MDRRYRRLDIDWLLVCEQRLLMRGGNVCRHWLVAGM